MKKVLALMAVILLIFQSAPTKAQSHRRVAKFGMPYLESFNTTEHGEDEVYIIISGKWDSGESFQYRVPGDAHWDLNDGEGDPPVRDWPLLNLEMDDGRSVDLVVMVMEEDGGSVGGWAALAGAAVGKVNPKAGSLIAAIGRLLDFHDSDDVLGVFSVHIENVSGDIIPRWIARDRVTRICDPASAWIKCNVEMNGDGSDYISLFGVTQE